LQIENAAELIGYFVPPDIYCKLVLPTMEDSANARQLRVFAAILKGSDRASLQGKLTDIGNFSKHAEICWSKEVPVIVEESRNIMIYVVLSLFTSVLLNVFCGNTPPPVAFCDMQRDNCCTVSNVVAFLHGVRLDKFTEMTQSYSCKSCPCA
jgi:hypothetical protein